MDIEDYGLTTNLSNEKYPHNYDSPENKEKIKTFILDNLHIRKWSQLESNIRAFAKINKIHIKKEDLIYMYNKLDLDEPEFYKIIIKKAMRSESGVLVVSLVTDDNPEYTDRKTGERKKQRFSCEWKCSMCPSEPPLEENNWSAPPKSYLTREPSLLRANKCGFDCVKQFRTRINTYIMCGQDLRNSKIEVIVLGGTISSYPKEYVEEFCRDTFYAANTIFDDREERLSIEEEIKINETAKVRIIGLTLETRPDCITLDEIKFFRRLGVTRVQIGVQHTDNYILKKINRGHNIESAKKAIKLLKDNSYKIDIHYMPLLPFSTPDMDREMLDTAINDPDLAVDQLKIYPCSVVPWTKIEQWYKDGTYVPYEESILMDVLIEFKQKVHPWIRLNRVVRDITSNYLIAGCTNPSMRNDIHRVFQSKGYICKCIRCREIKGRELDPLDIKLTINKYNASDGIEYFISYSSKDEAIIYGFLRLRIPSGQSEIMEELKNCSLIRELHVYSKMTPVDSKTNSNNAQHLGFGKKLLKEAEKISKRHGYYKISVISGIGVRQYYQKYGYKLNCNEMQKELTNYTKIFRNISIILSISFIGYKLVSKK
jgi:ELP3 family radical SAM enzyme/protein acetyltransferase